MVIFISMITNEIWWEGPGCQPCLAPPPFPEESSSWVEDVEYDDDAEHDEDAKQVVGNNDGDEDCEYSGADGDGDEDDNDDFW